MKIGICNDHAGVDYKNQLMAYLTSKGYEMVNFGTDTTDSMDYPDVAHPLAEAIEKGEVDLGIAFCGTGNGIGITLNKHQGIRAGLCWTPEIGKLIKQHNNANVLVMPATYSLSCDWRVSASLVALPMQTSSTPVASGSSVPACPTLRFFLPK